MGTESDRSFQQQERWLLQTPFKGSQSVKPGFDFQLKWQLWITGHSWRSTCNRFASTFSENLKKMIFWGKERPLDSNSESRLKLLTSSLNRFLKILLWTYWDSVPFTKQLGFIDLWQVWSFKRKTIIHLQIIWLLLAFAHRLPSSLKFVFSFLNFPFQVWWTSEGLSKRVS